MVGCIEIRLSINRIISNAFCFPYFCADIELKNKYAPYVYYTRYRIRRRNRVHSIFELSISYRIIELDNYLITNSIIVY